MATIKFASSRRLTYVLDPSQSCHHRPEFIPVTGSDPESIVANLARSSGSRNMILLVKSCDMVKPPFVGGWDLAILR